MWKVGCIPRSTTRSGSIRKKEIERKKTGSPFDGINQT
jgi:hypothetical protein